MLCSKAFVCALGLGALADAQLSLGTASGYGVFAASTITNTGLTTVGARIGLSPGSSITGFLPGINLGEDIDNAAAVQAKADIQSLYNALVAMPATTVLTGQDLGGQTLDAGVYSFASSGGLTGILTLDGQGDPNAVFVFQFGSTLTTATAAAVVLINGAQACNVYWQVGSSATLGTATVFAGVVVAQASITVTTVSDTVTVTQNVATSTTTCHSTTTKVSTHSTTKTVSATACPKKRELEARGRGHPVTKTKTETTECADDLHVHVHDLAHAVVDYNLDFDEEAGMH
ncbi:hypothetical protein B0A55_05838 [Friedmanniomyces simplex]|uniref:Ice-binding protein n=1 Tax=Friedmanniomyces simplex TaxID=329884 RepID=A0A4U0XI56_9PEZI|nr:hypothetical protein B0A55_05838 [Friedmanniomyces simplex]